MWYHSWGQVSQAHVQRAIRQARRWAEWSSRSGGHEEAPVTLAPTAYSRHTATEWLELTRAAVETVQNHAFGSKEPPFRPSEYGAAVDWIESELSKVPTYPQTSAGTDADSALNRVMPELTRVTGQAWEAGPNRFKVVYYGKRKGLVEVHEIRGVTRPRGIWALSPSSNPLAAVAALANDLGAAAGFRLPDVIVYLLCGVRPELPRVHVTARRVFST